MVQASTSKRYRDAEPGDVPLYAIAEAARYLDLPAATVRAWAMGRPYPVTTGTKQSPPLIKIADKPKGLLSFNNLSEIHVLNSIRQKHGVKLKAVRNAIRFLEEELGSARPLLSQKMLTDGKDLFVERYGQLVSISENGQTAMKEVLALYLKRIERNQEGMPVRLFPITRNDIKESPYLISIDPKIRFGRPCISGTGIPTAILAERYRAGESVALLADDYGRNAEEIEEAIRYESRMAS